MIRSEKAARKQLCKLVDPSASKAELRVEVAKDVLAGLAIGKLLTRRSYNYFYAPKTFEEKVDTRRFISESPTITVCALGALFAAQVARFDDHEIVSGKGTVFLDKVALFRNVVADKLAEVFSTDMMTEIEATFEGNFGFADWISKYPNDRDRLVAICENIVRNGGEFRSREF